MLIIILAILVVLMIFDILLLIKNDNTAICRGKIIDVIYEYNINHDDQLDYVLEPYEKTLFRFWDWVPNISSMTLLIN